MGSHQRLPSERARIARRFAVLVASAALLLPAPAVWLAPQAAASGSCPSGSTSVAGSSGTCEVTFDASGTWTIPDNVTSVDVVAVGAGGGGGSDQDPGASLPGAGGGGGGGAVVQATYQAVTPVASASITVGAGGAAGLTGVNGTAGGTSSFAAGSVSVSAAGGSPGTGGSRHSGYYITNTGYGGASGAGYAGGEPKLSSAGDIFVTMYGGGGGGSSAGGETPANDFSGGGDGGAGTVPSAGLFAGSTAAYAGGGGGGSTQSSIWPGAGAAGGGEGSWFTAGQAGTANTGGGGGSSAGSSGGAGGSGLVIVRFLAPGGNWGQTISFTSAAPSNAAYGGTYTPTASATSGLPVSFTSATSSVCSISGGVVSFIDLGTCTIDANQAGGNAGTYRAAPQVQQTFSVGKSSQTVEWNEPPPTNAVVGGTWTATGSASSGLPVIFAVDRTSSSACSVGANNVVTFAAAGYCAIDATQPGNPDYYAATPVLQSFTVAAVPVGPADQTISFGTAPSGVTVGASDFSVSATATSGLSVTYTAQTPSICTVDSATGALALLAQGTCTIAADQAGDGSTWAAAPEVTQSFTVAVPAVTILYVTQAGAGSGDCSSWANACSSLSQALTQATSGDQIWVAAGTYTPDTTGLAAPRTATFQLKAAVAVYGGFAGTETSLDQRNGNPATNGTVLSGDIGAAADSTDNVYHVVTGTNTAPLAVLDGFTVTGGNANGGGGNSDGAGMYNNPGSPTLRNVIFSANTAADEGGGMYNAASSPTLAQVAFSANRAGNYGGGMDNEAGSSPTLTDVTFSGNLAVSYEGGAIDNNNSSNPVLTNVTFSGNAAAGGAAIASFRSNVTVTNGTFSGNSSSWGAIAYNYSANLTIRNSILWGNSGNYWVYGIGSGTTAITYSVVQIGWSGVGNTEGYPLLGPLGYYGGATKTIPLLPGSAAIDAADSTACPATDQRGVTRPQGSGCDMGAFEVQPFSLSVSGGDSQTAAINQAFASPLRVTVTGTGTDPVAGGKVIFSAPAAGASATFSGNPATIGTDGTTSVTATANGTGGSYSVSASAAGATAPVSFSLTNIAHIAPTFTFELTGLSAKTYGDGGFSVAGYASKSADDTGAITFALGSGSTGCTVTSAGMVTVTGAAVDPASCIIEASLAADGAYLAAGPTSAGFHIARATPSFSSVAIDDATYDGSPHGATASVTGVGSPAADLGGASVSYALRSGSAEPYSYGTPTTTAPTDAGVYRVTFSYPGDADYTAVTDDAHTITISPAAPDFTFVLPDPFIKTYGDNLFSVAGYASEPADDTGAITFATGSGSVGCTVTSDGTVTITGASGAGACVIEASLAGDANYLGAGPLSQSFSIGRARAIISPTSGHATYGGTAILTASLNGGGLPLVGRTISFQIGTSTSATVGSATTDSNGVATLADVTLPTGYTSATVYPGAVIAHFAGDANYRGTGNTGDLTVGKAILTITPSGDQSMVYGSTPPANLAYTLSGFVNDETDAALRGAGALSGDASCSAGVSHTSSVASYAITCGAGGLAATNYDFAVSKDTVTFAVTPAILTITPSGDQSMVYGSTPPASLAYALGGFVNGETDAGLRGAGALSGEASCSVGVSQTSPVASYLIACTAGDLKATNYDFAASTDEVTFAVTPATLTVTADAKTVQYSDPVTLTATITGFVNGETLETSGVSGSASLTTAATLSLGHVTSAPGTYAITPALGTLAATNYIFTFVDGTLTATQEDARAYYTGDALFWGTSATASSAAVTLTATIKDITAVGDDPAHDDYQGDISHATVTFVNRDTGEALSGCTNLPVALVSSGDTTVGTVTCATTLSIANSGATPYAIGIVVSGYYTDDTSDENAVIDVAAPITSYFITGGGYLTDASSAGTYAADPGRKANFGFNVKFNKGAKNLQGNVNILFRKSGHTYQIKSNALTSLGETPSPCTKATATSSCTASFVSKANLQDITDPNNPVSLGGNLTFQMSMTDYGSPTKDTIGFTLYNGSALLFSSDWNGTKTVEQLLGGGNLSVR